MRRLPLLLCLLSALLLPAAAGAGAAPVTLQSVLRSARAATVIPVQWDGVDTTLDSTYTCAGVFQNTSTGADTICGGKDFTLASFGDSTLTFVCSGNSNATSYDISCTASAPAFSGCTVTYTFSAHSTLSGGVYHTVSVVDISYSGGGVCSLIPSSCTQTDTWGTRTGPAPLAYCSTPTRHPTWGQLKSIYR
jgi:hypothetical protein